MSQSQLSPMSQTQRGRRHTTSNELCAEKIQLPVRKLSESVSTYLVTVSEELKKLLQPEGFYEPELIVGLSEILDIDDVLNIKSLMYGKQSWHLAYSTSLDDHSLHGAHGLYKKLAQFHHLNDNESLLIILKDMDKHVFGVLMSTSDSKHDDCLHEDYGDDEERAHTTLFHCRPFKPLSFCSGEHQCHIRKYDDAFYIGYKDASCGLWIDEYLRTGRIQEFINSDDESIQDVEPEISEYKFEIKSMECWSFGYHPQVRNYTTSSELSKCELLNMHQGFNTEITI